MKIQFVLCEVTTKPVRRYLDFFYGDGPRSRRYGLIAALRLIVQPCDEDD
jgi:hypothetical protein